MTKQQRKEHKIGNQLRKEAFQKAYYKVRGLLNWGGLIQDGKYSKRRLQT